MSASSAPGRRGVDVVRHQLLAHASLAGDEHREVRGRHERDLAPQLRHRGARCRAAPRRSTGRRSRSSSRATRPRWSARCSSASMSAVVRSAAPASAPSVATHPWSRASNACGSRRVRRERAHDLAAFGQRAAEARVHLVQRPGRRLDAHRRTGSGSALSGGNRTGSRELQDDVEPRMLAPGIAPRQRRRGQTVPGHRAPGRRPRAAAGTPRRTESARRTAAISRA